MPINSAETRLTKEGFEFTEMADNEKGSFCIQVILVILVAANGGCEDKKKRI